MGLNYRGDPKTFEGEAWRSLVRDFPFLEGQLVTVDVGSSATDVQLFQHFLGRAYRGALILSQTEATGLTVISPSELSDPNRFFGLKQTTALTSSVTLWLF